MKDLESFLKAYEDYVRVCYCDESGTGSEPVATMVGIVVDATRMHLTKTDWAGLLEFLTEQVGKPIPELHTRNFYSGNGPYYGTNGEARHQTIDDILKWLEMRRHHLVYVSVLKEAYFNARTAGDIPPELGTIWRFMGFHLLLAMQKHCMASEGVKGNTIFIFDNENREEKRFADLIIRPPDWSDTYYQRHRNQGQMDQVIDVPFFADSKDVGLIQLADLIAFLLRRHAEIKEGLEPGHFDEEEEKLEGWVERIAKRSIGRVNIYPRNKRTDAENLFYDLAPASIREL